MCIIESAKSTGLTKVVTPVESLLGLKSACYCDLHVGLHCHYPGSEMLNSVGRHTNADGENHYRCDGEVATPDEIPTYHVENIID